MNTNVVLELEPSQLEILEGEIAPRPTMPAEDVAAKRKRASDKIDLMGAYSEFDRYANRTRA